MFSISCLLQMHQHVSVCGKGLKGCLSFTFLPLFIFFRQVKECLKLDQDHKQCFPFYKKTKKLVKQLKDAQEAINTEQWDECVNKGRQILKTESEIHTYLLKGKSHICHCLAKVGTVWTSNFNLTFVQFRHAETFWHTCSSDFWKTLWQKEK